MPQIITVDDLVNDTRSMLDEHNTLSVSTTDDILPALNRAQRYAANILTRHYEPPMLKHIALTLVGGQAEYPIPSDCLEERLEKVEVKINSLYFPLERVSYRDITQYESPSNIAAPYYYTVIGRNIRLLPKPTGAYPLRLWYLAEPMKLVSTQGTIQVVDTANMAVILDAVGADLATEIDNLNSFINIIDAESGVRKATLQIKNISGNQVKFKTVPSRSTVQTLTVDTSLTTLTVNTDTNNEGSAVAINVGDYICSVQGSCIPFFKNPFSNFLVQYAVAEIRRKLGGDTSAEVDMLKSLEIQVERSWVGREQTLRVKRSSSKFNNTGRRYLLTRA